MAEPQWSAVDEYYREALVRPDPLFDLILERSAAAGLPAISVTPAQGRLLELLARACGAHSILEIGTLGGYSSAWLARGLAPGGRVVTLEVEPRHAEVARENLRLAGADGTVEVVVGRAEETLPRFEAEGRRFDLVFIDADRPHYADYFRAAMRLAHPGSVIVADNVVRHGAIADPASEDVHVLGVRRFNEAVAAEPRALATALQTVSAKGYDGLAIVVVTSD